MALIKKLFENYSYSAREIKRVNHLVDEIEFFEDDMKKLSDDELRNKTDEFKDILKNKTKTLDEILTEAFAVAREASRRVLGMRHFRVQLIGGIILHQGRIAEMRTGEGKTLVAILAAYLNSLEGRGVHIVTVNDYLVTRDSEWMGKVFRFLNVSVGAVINDMTVEQRREAYNCDVTYTTNNELGFDYLRDNMAISINQIVQRELNYAIIDEIDSILIDEARTPLIISGSGIEATRLYNIADIFVKRLTKGKILNQDEALNPITREEIKEEGDFVVDEKAHAVTLTQYGVAKAEEFFRVKNFSDANNLELQHYINNALKANYIMFRDKDYVLKDGEIIIVDEFTGRLMPGRRYSDGLHQAIEAKEKVKINRESRTLATITFQNFFNKYKKKCGMTGTAMTEQTEFREIYGMDVVAIETNKPIIRIDHPDCVYRTEKAKLKAVVEDIIDSHKKGQPVLVGAITIDKSEEISRRLISKNIPHNVLNAKYHAKEAEIISQAGKKNSVTIATNMAGRGTDIKLEDGVQELGGLKIIGTERHESRRIDNQLRGRSGRQGDPGESKFYISLEDDLMRLFGSERMMKIVDALGIEEDDVIEHKILSKAIENAQKKVEANNFAIRRHLLQYDQVMNEQREIIYAERKKVLMGENLKENVLEMLSGVINRCVDLHTSNSEFCEEWNLNSLNEFLKPIFHKTIVYVYNEQIKINNDDSDSDNSSEENNNSSKENNNSDDKKLKKEKKKKAKDCTRDSLKKELLDIAKKIYDLKEQEIGFDQMREIERIVILRMVDQHWMEHIDNMHRMRQNVSLRAYAQRDPVIEYKFLSYDMFEEMSNNIQLDSVRGLFNVQIQIQPKPEEIIQQENIVNDNELIKNKHKKIGRNDLCPCGSGKKYKNCCEKKAK